MDKKKKKFKPIITRVKLNPEQAVLTCPCYNYGYAFPGGENSSQPDAACDGFSKAGWFGSSWGFSSSSS